MDASNDAVKQPRLGLAESSRSKREMQNSDASKGRDIKYHNWGKNYIDPARMTAAMRRKTKYRNLNPTGTRTVCLQRVAGSANFGQRMPDFLTHIDMRNHVVADILGWWN